MKKKFTKPEINILMDVILLSNEENQNDENNIAGYNGDINGSIVEGDNEDW